MTKTGNIPVTDTEKRNLTRSWVFFLLAVILYQILHEGSHLLTSLFFDEFEGLRFATIGPEVVYKTPVPERSGFHWTLISGMSSIITIILGYILLINSEKTASLRNVNLKALLFYTTLVLLITDPLNLSVGPFLYGGDAPGVAKGMNVPVYLVQGLFFVIFLINRELVASILLSTYKIETKHFLFRSWLRKSPRVGR